MFNTNRCFSFFMLKEKYLGVEFRTPTELNEIQQRVLTSFKFLSE